MSYKTEAEAKSAGEKLLARMKGDGWRLRVWENLGWHISVINWPIAVNEIVLKKKILYYVSMTDDPESKFIVGLPTYLCADHRNFSDPNEAVEAQLKFARTFAEQILAAVKHGESIVDGKPCSACDGDGSILKATGDEDHPVKAIACPACGIGVEVVKGKIIKHPREGETALSGIVPCPGSGSGVQPTKGSLDSDDPPGGDVIDVEDKLMEKYGPLAPEDADQVPQMLADKGEIVSAYYDSVENFCFKVGEAGVTAIKIYAEPGQYCQLPWLAVYKGDKIIARAPAGHVSIHYKESE